LFGVYILNRRRIMLKRKKQTLSLRHNEDVARADITIRLPIWLLDHIRGAANDCGVPHEDIIKIWLTEKVLDREKLSTRPVRYGR
jgi:hypothetical protein